MREPLIATAILAGIVLCDTWLTWLARNVAIVVAGLG